jgi:hypothetical protein
VEGLGEKGIASQQRNSLAKDLMVSQLPPSEIIVVQGREIVVDDRIGMDELEGAGKGEEQFMLSSEELSSSQGQDGTKPLSSGENAITHRLIKSFRILPALLKAPIQRTVDKRLSLS